jgi:superfamily II DNA or RNA helicase
LHCQHSRLINNFVEEANEVLEFHKCGLTYEFLGKYIIHAALTVVEDNEREKILAMKYSDFVEVNIIDIVERIVDFLSRLYYACNQRPLNDRDRAILINLVKKYDLARIAICHLYTCGIIGDGIPYLVIENPDYCLDPHKVFDKINVKSRFSEIAHYLSKLKQRFPDISSFEAKQLVLRVFAFNELRWIPIARRDVDQVSDMLVKYVSDFYEKFCGKVTMGEMVEECKAPSELGNVIKKFMSELAKEHGIQRLYEFQYRGLEETWKSLIEALDGKEKYIILEAPTGSGKSEVFLFTSLLLSLVKKYLCMTLRVEEHCSSPVALIVYPRLALARDQFDRLVKYAWTLNKVLRDIGKEPVTISISNMDVLPWSKYKVLLEELGDKVPVEGSVKSPYVEIPVKINKDQMGVYIEFTGKFSFFKCPHGEYPRVYVRDGEPQVVCAIRNTLEDFNFVKIFRDIVREKPGDIHVTLFETLRLNLLSKHWEKLLGRGDVLGGPLLIVIDEIHTQVGIKGARYSYLLRRLMTKINWLTGRKHGYVTIGLSATIPERGSEEFLKALFLQESNENIIRVKPERSEMIPAGSDYFYIIVPNFKEMVDAMSVSIQTLMALHLNASLSPDLNKKTFAFADSLEVVSRLRNDLSDALLRRRLQDLRNPLQPLFEVTCKDYREHTCEVTKSHDPITKLLDILPKIRSINSWRDGELWWPYALESEKYNDKYKVNLDVRMYTSRKRDNLDLPGIIVSTSSLELGVDYSDVVVIYQHGAPTSISALIQRAGRGGRRVFENPLLRTIIAIQLSPEIPHQSYLLEVFLRSKSLRDALNYDALYVPTENITLKKQTLAELVLDYYVLSFKSSRGINPEQFECKELPEFANEKRPYILHYAMDVLKANKQYIDKLIDEILIEIQRACSGGTH